MLPLDDDRWTLLTPFYGEPDEVPLVLRGWLASVGTEEETTVYGRDLFDLFLHQGTITNIAFALVPWLVHVCKDAVTPYRVATSSMSLWSKRTG